jgi:ubiquitin C-terminal hydrolase
MNFDDEVDTQDKSGLNIYNYNFYVFVQNKDDPKSTEKNTNRSSTPKKIHPTQSNFTTLNEPTSPILRRFTRIERTLNQEYSPKLQTPEKRIKESTTMKRLHNYEIKKFGERKLTFEDPTLQYLNVRKDDNSLAEKVEVYEKPAPKMRTINDLKVERRNNFLYDSPLKQDYEFKSKLQNNTEKSPMKKRANSPKINHLKSPSKYYPKFEVRVEKAEKNPKETKNFHGLPNLGRTCYMNSALQCLFEAKEFMDELLTFAPNFRHVTSMLQELYKIIDTQDLERKETILKGLLVYVSKTDSEFADHKQRDCYEFLTVLFDCMSIELERHKSSKRLDDLYYQKTHEKSLASYLEEKALDTNNFIRDNFNTVISTKIECQSCMKSWFKFEEQSSFSLQIKNNSKNLYDLFDEIFSANIIERDCSFCKRMTYTKTEKLISKFSNYLIVHLNKGVIDQNNQMAFNEKIVYQMNNLFYLSKYSRNQEISATYELLSFILYNGNTAKGHYSCCKKIANQWYHINDDICTPIESEFDYLNNEKCLIQFYKLKKN